MSSIPELKIRAWPSDAMEKLGGLVQLAGGDPQDTFNGGILKDHPAIHCRVRLPMGTGVIDDCLVHPRGYLTFDVRFDYYVPEFLVQRDYSIDAAKRWKQYEENHVHKFARTQQQNGYRWHFLRRLSHDNRDPEDGTDIPGVTRFRTCIHRFSGDELEALIIV